MRNFGPILVPVDFSVSSSAALRFAIDLASDSGAMIRVLHVMAADAALGAVTQRMNAFLSESPSTTFAVEIGDPYARIVMAAANEGFRLIVMGTHGQSTLIHARMGSIAEQVAKRAPCPVVTVHAPAQTSDLVPWFPRDATGTFEITHTLAPRTQIDLAVLASLKIVCPNTDTAEVALACLSCPELKMACVSMGAGRVESVCHKHPRHRA